MSVKEQFSQLFRLLKIDEVNCSTVTKREFLSRWQNIATNKKRPFGNIFSKIMGDRTFNNDGTFLLLIFGINQF